MFHKIFHGVGIDCAALAIVASTFMPGAQPRSTSQANVGRSPTGKREPRASGPVSLTTSG
jgi:hypothetical protein